MVPFLSLSLSLSLSSPAPASPLACTPTVPARTVLSPTAERHALELQSTISLDHLVALTEDQALLVPTGQGTETMGDLMLEDMLVRAEDLFGQFDSLFTKRKVFLILIRNILVTGEREKNIFSCCLIFGLSPSSRLSLRSPSPPSSLCCLSFLFPPRPQACGHPDQSG